MVSTNASTGSIVSRHSWTLSFHARTRELVATCELFDDGEDAAARYRVRVAYNGALLTTTSHFALDEAEAQAKRLHEFLTERGWH